MIGPAARQAAAWLSKSLPAGARLTSDSRAIRRGDAFFAYPGANDDGRRHIGQALAAGAGAVLFEAAGADGASGPRPVSGTPTRAVADLRREAGPIAAAWLGEPSERMTVVAVTGTNGKTSCTHWIAQGWNARIDGPDGDGRAVSSCAAVIGTLGAGVPGEPEGFADADPAALAAPSCATTACAASSVAPLTTPDALAFQQRLAAFAARGIDLVAVEASSIGLEQGRLDGTKISVAVLTNLTRDHLDYHGTMQAYADAKARLFCWPGLDAVVVNLEDPVSTRMLDAAADPGTFRIGYLVDDAPGPTQDALARADQCDALLIGTPQDGCGQVVLTLVTRGDAPDDEPGSESIDLQIGLIGRFNLSNALAVAGVWLALGWPLARVATQLEGLQPVVGRLELVGDPADPTLPLAVVDYAHTPDALANALGALRPLATGRGGRLWCVLGAGGNRDAGKRPVMAGAAQGAADVVVLTSDNPRDESPDAILAQLAAGLSRPAHRVDPDRARAIAAVIAEAAPADVVLIAGKGHERYQEIVGVRQPFSDVEEARRALDARAVASAVPGPAADGEGD